MQIQPILAALRRHKAGTLLIALQIALTLAIVCNALFIIQQRLAHVGEATGVDEQNVFVIENMWGEQYSTQEAAAKIKQDMLTLRQLPGVEDAAPANSYPLRTEGWDDLITLTPEQVKPTTDATVFVGDEHLLHALGAKLIAGRDFHADEIVNMGNRENPEPPVTIVTKALADKLYPNGDALGKTLYSMTSTPSTIIGIIDTLHRADVDASSIPYAGQVMIWPMRPAYPEGLVYIVRAKPGQLEAAMREAPTALYAVNRMRTIDPEDGILSFAQVRQRAYESDRGMAMLMGIISMVLLAITAAGIVGLTSFWVGQRRRQIGVRRALGATRRDIVHYFLTENLLISFAGITVGVVLAFGSSTWLVTHYELKSLPPSYVLSGVVILLLLGQAAVLTPALRASRVPPVEATRPA